MKEWRVIALLLAVIVLLSVILGIKIINNTPEKQIQKAVSDYNELKIEKIKKTNNEEFNFSYFFEKEKNKEESWVKKNISTPVGLILGIILVVVMVVGYVQLYNKLCISPELIRINLISVFVYILGSALTAVPITIFSSLIMPIITLIAIITFVVTLIMLEYKFFQALDTSFFFVLLILIPGIGSIILNIILGIRLANKFDRGILFKIALCILPNIFRPILGFIA